MGKFWNLFKKSKSSTSNDFASLSVDKLYDYFEKKFSYKAQITKMTLLKCQGLCTE